MMSALMSDTISGRVSPQVANATINAGGKLLKVVEMQEKYGKPTAAGTKEDLQLVSPTMPGQAAITTTATAGNLQ
jgi:hypothetical protein